MLEPFLGEVVLYAFPFAPIGWLPCLGEMLAIQEATGLFSLLGTDFGGDGKTTFGLPNYKTMTPTGMQYSMANFGIPFATPAQRPTTVGETAILPFKSQVTPASWLMASGYAVSISDYDALFKVIGTRFGGDGKTTFAIPDLSSTPPPNPNGWPDSAYRMAYEGNSQAQIPYIAEIRLFPYSFAPEGWSFCEGQLMAIQSNTALFSLMGNTFVGDGQIDFALPDLRQANVPAGSAYCIALIGDYPQRQ